jgi:DNA-binding YbaB/EbfC family protein
MDLSQIMQMASYMQGQLAKAQEETAAARYTGEAGAGMVRLIMNGRYEVLEVHVDPKAVTDVGLLEDLVRAAVNHVTTQISQALQNRMTGMAQGLGLDNAALDMFKPRKSTTPP